MRLSVLCARDQHSARNCEVLSSNLSQGIIMFSVELSRRAKKEYDHLDDEKIKEALDCLKLDSVPAKFYDVRKLEGTKDSFRIRLGKIRILYIVIEKQGN